MRPEWITAFGQRHGLGEATLAELDAEVARQLALAAPTMPPPEAAGVEAPDPFPVRYQDLGPLAEGGMGEVRRVYDTHLQRTLAMKLLRRDAPLQGGRLLRFVAEAQATAQLQHPGVVPVHDLGTLSDGRPWFTMREIEGLTLQEAIEDHHAEPDGRWTRRRLLTAFVTVCDTVAYAHGRGVVHRDLKPLNVIVGPFGEVLVLDWGLAKVGEGEGEGGGAPVQTDWERSGGTVDGSVSGTPAYMAPEQARAGEGLVDARTDVYALGAVLYHMLSGRPPYTGVWREALDAMLQGPPLPVTDAATRPVPDALAAICRRAMARDPGARLPSAGALARAVDAWLDGSQRRTLALQHVAEARARADEVAALEAEAADLARAGDDALAALPAWAEEDRKAEGWSLQERGQRTAREAALVDQRAERALHAALRLVPDLPEARALLLGRALRRLERAELEGDEHGVALAEADAAAHADALPAAHPARVTCARVLEGDGALTLLTDPPGASVELLRYRTIRRRLVAEPAGELGTTPLVDHPLPMGRYLAILRHPGRAEVRYPFVIRRGGHWDGVPPDASEPEPVWLPLADDLGPDDIYVPAGWFDAGGDLEAAGGLPHRRLWCPGVVLERYSVTVARYLAFLNDRVERGEAGDAERWAPRSHGPDLDTPGPLAWDRTSAGAFRLPERDRHMLWQPDYPVCMVSWHGARAFAAWEAQRRGQPWRLPGELEWEKAARGPDGRRWPWGETFDPSWCLCRAGHPEGMQLEPVTGHPVDESPYGVRGMAGGMRDWCGEAFDEHGPPAPGQRVQAPVPSDAPGGPRAVRGGSWLDNVAHRACFRIGIDARSRNPFMGLRLARSLP